MPTCLFDLDGTLVNSTQLIVNSFRHTVQHHHGTSPNDDVFVQGIGLPLREQMSAFSVNDTELDTMIETFSQYYIAHHNRDVHPFPGIAEALEKLKSRAKLGIVTSKIQKGAIRSLSHCGLMHFFDVIVGAEDTTRGKPHADPVNLAINKLQSTPAETIFVGDSPHDMLAGRAAGVQIVAVGWGPFEQKTLEECKPHQWLYQTSEIAMLA